MVGACAVGGGGGTAQGEVPFEEVGVEGGGVEGGVWVGGELGGFFEDAFDGGGFGVEGWEGHGGDGGSGGNWVGRIGTILELGCLKGKFGP